MIGTLRPSTNDPRRKRQHNVRRVWRSFKWHEIANRHKRRKWRESLRAFRGKEQL